MTLGMPRTRSVVYVRLPTASSANLENATWSRWPKLGIGSSAPAVKVASPPDMGDSSTQCASRSRFHSFTISMPRSMLAVLTASRSNLELRADMLWCRTNFGILVETRLIFRVFPFCICRISLKRGVQVTDHAFRLYSLLTLRRGFERLIFRGFTASPAGRCRFIGVSPIYAAV